MSGFNQILKSSFIILSASFLIACSGAPPKDLGYLPEGDLRPCPSSPNCELVSFENPYGLRSGIDKLKASIMMTGGELISQQQVSAQKTYLHSEYTSLIMRFVDDVELVVNEDKVILRSASRLGHSDFGVNAARVEDIKAAFFAEQ